MPVEVNGKRFSVKVWVPEGAMTAAPAASGGNGQRKRATAARAVERSRWFGHGRRADAGNDREGARRPG